MTRLRAVHPRIVVIFPAGARHLSLLLNVQQGLGLTQPLIQGVQLKSGPYLVFNKKLLYLISAKICGEIL